MDLRRLRYFVAVAEELNFTRAAERLHMAQPPLSTQIRALEDETGAQLFDRDKRRVSLTQAGRHLLGHARNILASVEVARSEVRRAALGEIGTLRFGYTASAMFTRLLPAAVRRFQASHPQVLLALREMTSLDQVNALHSRALDAGVLRNPRVPVPGNIVLTEWYRAPLVLAVSSDHPFNQRRTIRVSQLRDQPLIMYPREAGIGLYWQVMDMCAKAQFHPRVVAEVLEPSTIVGLVAAGVGLAIVPADTSCIQLPGVTYMRLGDASAFSTLCLGYRRSDRNSHLDAFLATLRAARAD